MNIKEYINETALVSTRVDITKQQFRSVNHYNIHFCGSLLIQMYNSNNSNTYLICSRLVCKRTNYSAEKELTY